MVTVLKRGSKSLRATGGYNNFFFGGKIIEEGINGIGNNEVFECGKRQSVQEKLKIKRPLIIGRNKRRRIGKGTEGEKPIFVRGNLNMRRSKKTKGRQKMQSYPRKRTF